MSEITEHTACVDRWIGRMSPSTAEDHLQLLRLGVGVLWKRASPTLGPITLGAITNRVLHTVAGTSAILDAVTVGDMGLELTAAFEQVRTNGQASALDATVRAVLIELLTVLGNVTGDILVGPLRQALELMSGDALLQGARPREKDTTS